CAALDPFSLLRPYQQFPVAAIKPPPEKRGLPARQDMEVPLHRTSHAELERVAHKGMADADLQQPLAADRVEERPQVLKVQVMSRVDPQPRIHRRPGGLGKAAGDPLISLRIDLPPGKGLGEAFSVQLDSIRSRLHRV